MLNRYFIQHSLA